MICSDAKLLAKILSIRLNRVAPSLISSDQAGFIRGRRAHDHVLSAQYVIHFCMRYSLLVCFPSWIRKKLLIASIGLFPFEY